MPTIVNTTTGSTSFGTSHSVTIPAVTAGNAVFLIFDDGGSTTISNELVGATALTALHAEPFATFSVDFCFYGAENLSGGQTTVSWTTSSSVAAWYRVWEVSGATITLDGTPASTNDAFTTAPSVGFTTAGVDSLAMGIFINSSGRTLTGVTAGYTVDPSSGSDFYFSAINPALGAAGAKTLAGTWGSGVTSLVAVVVVQAASGGTPQIARPDADVTDGAWLPSTGADLYATLDETTPTDTDFDYTPSASTMEVSLGSLTDPASSADHIVRYRIRGSQFPASKTLVVSLRQGGATQIAAWTHSGLPGDFTTFERTLTGGEADSITDYTDLRLRFVAS